MTPEEYIKKIYASSSIGEALEFKKNFEKDFILALKDQIATASPEEKKKLGLQINSLKQLSDEAFYQVKEAFQSKEREIQPLDLSICNSDFSKFSRNLLQEVKSDLIKIFDDLDFVIESGSEVVNVEDNFEELCVPDDHPSRSKSETFYVDKSRILRPHCTVNSIIYLKNTKDKNKSARIATIGNVYRRDDESPRHTHQFSQVDFA